MCRNFADRASASGTACHPGKPTTSDGDPGTGTGRRGPT
jgi:hypothetical protein